MRWIRAINQMLWAIAGVAGVFMIGGIIALGSYWLVQLSEWLLE